MSKNAVFTMKLDSELRSEFMTEVANEDRPASQVMRELMRDYIEKRRQSREYEDYLRSKVEASRASMRNRIGQSNDDIEAVFAAKRKQVTTG